MTPDGKIFFFDKTSTIYSETFCKISPLNYESEIPEGYP